MPQANSEGSGFIDEVEPPDRLDVVLRSASRKMLENSSKIRQGRSSQIIILRVDTGRIISVPKHFLLPPSSAQPGQVKWRH